MSKLEYFFADAATLEGGFSLYGPVHLAWLAGMGLVVAGLCVLYRRQGAAGRVRTKRALALWLVAQEIIKNLVFCWNGSFNAGHLPLHMCGLAIFVYLWDAWRPGKLTNELMYALCMPGALSALLFPDWTSEPPDNFACIHSFTIHALLTAYVLMQLTAGTLRPRLRELWRVVVFLLVIVPPIYGLNKLWNQNFLFVNVPSPGSPLEPLGRWLGNPGYLVGYVALLFVVWGLMYLPWVLADRKKAARVAA